MTKKAKKQQPEKFLKLQSEPGVTRVDHRNTHGWLMRLHHQGTTYTKLFSDGVYGGAKKALKAARKYRKQLGKTLGIESLSQRRRTRSVSSRNTATGVVGVYRLTSKGKNGVARHYYAASWNPEPNKVKTKSFSIAKYGEAEAFRLAVEYRQNMVAKIMGRQPEVERVQSAPRYAPADVIIAKNEDDKKTRKAKSKKKKRRKEAQRQKEKVR
ncbi:MAG: hypothetical protein CMR00_08475 [[Chlorobium] sp. 445]|nr:MAG: hypothetical protein CMR00_08475 [[Chlorobium] sp. 445]